MIGETNIKLLWISDLHYAEKYKDLASVASYQKFLNQFLDCVMEQHLPDVPIDYILLSGDLGSFGKYGDYVQLNKLLLHPLLEKMRQTGNPLPRVLTLPGNHDVNRESNDFLADFITNVTGKDHKSGEISKQLTRPEFLLKYEDNFRRLFNGYSQFLTEARSGPYKEAYALTGDGGLVYSSEYAAEGLYGYVVDRRRQMIFILLNSAWYSMGGGFNDLYADQILEVIRKDYKGKEITAAQIIEWLKTRDQLADYANQISGIQLLKQEKLDALLQKYPDYFVLTSMHHPKNWLHYDESYSHDKNDSTCSSFLLNDLLSKSDVFLTGHEHVPIDTATERLLNTTLHLKTGCFLELGQAREQRYEKSWFSILNINISKREILQHRYGYNPLPDHESWQEELWNHPPLKKIGLCTLTTERRREVERLIAKGTKVQLLHYLKRDQSRMILDNELRLITGKKNVHEQWYALERTDGKRELCIFAVGQNPFRERYLNQEFKNELIALLNSDENVSHIRFITLDLLVEESFSIAYEKPCDLKKVLNGIARRADNSFNVFRHVFFMEWEDQAEKGILDLAEFERFKRLRFLNQIIPFWVAERFWFN
ncbi:metallophosphoesterase family protein [Mucilaginibacter pedocola]|uniref:Calcineurin-like phosphoesterase domain-containing protein n=1 Tax=Mucilaginibacter pedocola TaxID=1792845 RepID=A0A1S9PGA6_9SPHI|nr:metallophosphoesterase [Mucilaginibacter pedocola]OOQ60005.1 hypothetical protein BC343_27125 [Mucilaginibacter pedocola]